MKRRNLTPLIFCLLILMAAMPACGRPEFTGLVGGLPIGTLRIEAGDPLVLDVELAATTAAQARGLMGVEKLPEDYGLVFAWADTGIHSFYMKDTLVPLDIAWWNKDGKIVDIQTMEPCIADPCRIYVPAGEHTSAVEVKAGLMKSAGVEVGDRVVLEQKQP